MLLEDKGVTDSITQDITATPSGGIISFNVNDPTLWPTNGQMEVGSELFFITAGGANPVSAQRAFGATTAAAHTSGDLARRDPRYGTPQTNEAIQVAVCDWCSFYLPRLVWDSSTGGTFSTTKWVVEAPSDAMSVEEVKMQFPGGWTRMQDVGHGLLQTYPTSIVSSGFGFELRNYDWVSGYTIHVLYGKRWPFLSADADTVPSDFPADGDDLIVTGAALYLAGWRQVPKFKVDEVQYQREEGTYSQAQYSSGLLRSKMLEWVGRAQQVRRNRPNQWPRKIWMP